MGDSPEISGGKESVIFDLNSSLNGAMQCKWEINIIADAKTLSIIGNPKLSTFKGSDYNAEFYILGKT